MKLYAGNLPPTFSDKDLEELFSPFGAVKSAKMILDHATGRSKGFGFVEMGNEEEAKKAMEALHDQLVGKGKIVVNEARPPKPREHRSGGGGGGGGGGYHRGGGRSGERSGGRGSRHHSY